MDCIAVNCRKFCGKKFCLAPFFGDGWIRPWLGFYKNITFFVHLFLYLPTNSLSMLYIKYKLKIKRNFTDYSIKVNWAVLPRNRALENIASVANKLSSF